MKTKKKGKILACLLFAVMLACCLPTKVLAEEPASGTYSYDGWVYIWDADAKELKISDDAGKLAAATPIGSTISLKDAAQTVKFVDGIKIPDGPNPDNPGAGGFQVLNYIGGETKYFDMSGADTSGVTSMYHMFSSCASLLKIDVSGIDTSNVRYMNGMFDANTSLQSIVGLQSLNTSKAERIPSMFANDFYLTDLDLSGFEIKAGCDVNNLLFGCNGLETLNMHNLDFSGARGTDLVKNCTSLRRIDTPLAITPELDGLPFDMYEDKPGDPLAETPAYKDNIPSNKTLWRKNPVIFLDDDKTTEIAKQLVKYEQDADPSRINAPDRPGFHFVEWVDKDGNPVTPGIFKNITAPVKVYARYVPRAQNPTEPSAPSQPSSPSQPSQPTAPQPQVSPVQPVSPVNITDTDGQVLAASPRTGERSLILYGTVLFIFVASVAEAISVLRKRKKDS